MHDGERKAARNRIRCDVEYVSGTLVQVYDDEWLGKWREGIFYSKRDDDIVWLDVLWLHRFDLPGGSSIA